MKVAEKTLSETVLLAETMCAETLTVVVTQVSMETGHRAQRGRPASLSVPAEPVPPKAAEQSALPGERQQRARVGAKSSLTPLPSQNFPLKCKPSMYL